MKAPEKRQISLLFLLAGTALVAWLFLACISHTPPSDPSAHFLTETLTTPESGALPDLKLIKGLLQALANLLPAG
ncbi:MAG: hypothetical protein AAFN81_24790 [Bacteroidota bacterium]